MDKPNPKNSLAWDLISVELGVCTVPKQLEGCLGGVMQYMHALGLKSEVLNFPAKPLNRRALRLGEKLSMWCLQGM